VKVETPLLVPVLCALPVCACMAILGLPSFGHGYAAAFRTLYFVACLVWIVPLALLRASRTYMPALAEALGHLNKKTA
jgi:two-component system sensor histidine kinase AlgZ